MISDKDIELMSMMEKVCVATKLKEGSNKMTDKLKDAIATMEKSYKAYMDIKTEKCHIGDSMLFDAFPPVVQAARKYAAVAPLLRNMVKECEECKEDAPFIQRQVVRSFLSRIAAIISEGEEG